MFVRRLLSAALIVYGLSVSTYAKCDTSTGFDLVSRTCWQCMLPITLATVPIMTGPMPDAAGPITSSPICTCPMPPPIFIRIGIPISLYNPNTVAEVVKDPMCLPSLGLDLGDLVPSGTLQGAASGKNGAAGGLPRTFFQSHRMVFPMLYMLGVFLDTACFQQADMDIAYLSEPDPTWNMDGMAAYLAPESVLFGNPVVALTCSADAIAASIYYTMDALFMCKGSHGMAYPMTGNVQPKNYVEDSASVAENMIYHEHRLGTGTTPGLCFKIPTPIWKKSDYRLQIVKPLPHVMGMTVGQSGLMWTYAKNVPYKGDNFVYLVFKKVNCCAF